MEDFEYRKDFNKFKKEMKQFTDRRNKEFQVVKNKHGVGALPDELRQIEKDTQQAQELTRKLISDIEDRAVYQRGKKVSDVREQMRMMKQSNKVNIEVPVDFDFDKIDERERLMERAEAMKRKTDVQTFDRMKHIMQENLLGLMEKGLNSYADDTIKYLKNQSPEKFYQLFVSIDELDFNLYSSPDGELLMDAEPKDVVDALNRSIRSFTENNQDMDLDQFP